MISTLPLPAPQTPIRTDGWTPERQVAFVSHLADNGNIAHAAKATGMGVSGAYALRRRREGIAFDLGWDAALVIARKRLADELMARAIDGEEVITEREDTRTRRRAPNYRLGLALLDRVKPEAAEPQVSAAIADFDAFLEVLGEGGSATALAAFLRDRISNAMVLKKLLSTLPLPQIPAEPAKPKPLYEIYLVGKELRCTYPPPPDYEGREYGSFGQAKYNRTLTPHELAVLEAEQETARQARHRTIQDLAAEAAKARDARFGVPNSGRDSGDSGTVLGTELGESKGGAETVPESPAPKEHPEIETKCALPLPLQETERDLVIHKRSVGSLSRSGREEPSGTDGRLPCSPRIIRRIKPGNPSRVSLRRHLDVVRRHQILPGLNPAAPIAFVADMTFGAVARQIDLGVPLPVANADRAASIKVAVARLEGNAVQCMGILRGRTMDDALFV